jgi:hypothetical protein
MFMFRSTGVLFVSVMTLAAAAQAEQRPAGTPTGHAITGLFSNPAAGPPRGYREGQPSGWRQFVPGMMVAPALSLFSSLQPAAPQGARGGPDGRVKPPAGQGVPGIH